MVQTTSTNGNELQFDAKDIAENKMMAVLSYISFLVFVPLLARKNSKFAQAHAKQGLIILIATVIVSFIPVAGWIVDILIIVVDVIALISAAQGKFWKIPGVYDLSVKLKI